MINLEIEMQKAREWIAAGKPCWQCFGFIWKGATPRRISSDKAMELLNSGYYTFGMNYNELRWTEDGLVFFEFSEADML